jgi:methylmalonyl-CoA mutase
MATRGQAGGLSPATAGCLARLTNDDFDYVIIETVGTGQEALPFRSEMIDQTVLVMNPDYGARLQLQKIVMLDVADIVVVNKTDLDRSKAARLEIEHRLGQNDRDQKIVATVAKRHRDPGVDELYQMIARDSSSVAAVYDRRKQKARRSQSAATGKAGR